MSEGTPRRGVHTSHNNFTDYAQQQNQSDNRLFQAPQTIENSTPQKQSNANYSIFTRKQNGLSSSGRPSQGSITSRKMKVAQSQQQQQQSSISLTKPSTPRSAMGLLAFPSQQMSPATANNQHRGKQLASMFNFPVQQQQQQQVFFQSLQEQQQQQFQRFPQSQSSQQYQQNNPLWSPPTAAIPSVFQPYHPPELYNGYASSNNLSVQQQQERIQHLFNGNCSSPSNSSSSTSRSNKATMSATQSSNYFYPRGTQQQHQQVIPSMGLLATSSTHPYIQQNQRNTPKPFKGTNQSHSQSSAAVFINPFTQSPQKQPIQPFMPSESSQQQSIQPPYEGITTNYKQNNYQYSPQKIVKLMEYLCSRGEMQQCAEELAEYCRDQLKEIAIVIDGQSQQQNYNNISDNSTLLSWVCSIHSLISTASTHSSPISSSPFADVTLPSSIDSRNFYSSTNPFRDGLLEINPLLNSQLQHPAISLSDTSNPYLLTSSVPSCQNTYDPAIEVLEAFMAQLLFVQQMITTRSSSSSSSSAVVTHQKLSSMESIRSNELHQYGQQLQYLDDQCRYLNGLGVASIRRGNLSLGFQQFQLLTEIIEGSYSSNDNTNTASCLSCKVRSSMLNNAAVCALIQGEFDTAERILSRSVSSSEGQLFPLIQSVSRKYLTKDQVFLEELAVMLFGYVYAQVLQRIKGRAKERGHGDVDGGGIGIENNTDEHDRQLERGWLVDAPFLKNAIGLARKYFNPSHRIIEVLLKVQSILDEPAAAAGGGGENSSQSRNSIAHIPLILRVLQECGLELDSREVVRVVRFEQLQRGYIGKRENTQRESGIEQQQQQHKLDQHRKLKIHDNNNSSFKMKTASNTISICHNASHSSGGQDTTMRSYVGIGNASRVSTEPSLFRISSQRIPKEDLMMREGHAKEDGGIEENDESTPYFDKNKKGMKDNGNKVTGHRKNSTSQGNNKSGQLKYIDHVREGGIQGRNDLNRSEDQIGYGQRDELIGNQLQQSPVQSEGDTKRKEQEEEVSRKKAHTTKEQQQQQQQNNPSGVQRNSQKISSSEIKQINPTLVEVQAQITQNPKNSKTNDKIQMQQPDIKSQQQSLINQQPSQELSQLQQQQIIQISTLEASIHSMMSKLLSSSVNLEQEKQSTIKEISSLRSLLSNLTESQRTTSQQLHRQQQQFIDDQIAQLKKLESQMQQQEAMQVQMQQQQQLLSIPPSRGKVQSAASSSSAPLLGVLLLLESQPQKSLGLVKSISINNKVYQLTSRLYKSGQLELIAMECISGSSNTQQKQLAKQTLSKEQLKLILLNLNYHPILPATFSLNMCQSTYLLNKYFLIPFLAFDPGLNELKILSSACGLLSKVQEFMLFGETISWWLHYIEGNTFRIVLAKKSSAEQCFKVDLDMDMGSMKKWFECLSENEYAKEELEKLIGSTRESEEQRNEQMKELQQRVWMNEAADKGDRNMENKNKDGTYKVRAFRVLNESVLVTEITELIKVIVQTIQDQTQGELRGSAGGQFNGIMKQPYFVRVRIWSLGQKKVIQIAQENMISGEIAVKVILRNVHLTFGPGGGKIRAQGNAVVSCKQIQQVYGLEYPGLHRSEKIAILSHLPDFYALNVHEKNDESLQQKEKSADAEPDNAIVKQAIVSAAYMRVMMEVNLNQDGIGQMNFGSTKKEISGQSSSTGYLLPLTLELIGAAGRLLGVRVLLYNHGTSRESGLFLTVDEQHWQFENKIIIKNSHHLYLDPPPLSQYFISHIFQHIICPILKKHILIVRDSLDSSGYALKLNRGLLAPNSTSIYRIENIITNQIISEEGRKGIQ